MQTYTIESMASTMAVPLAIGVNHNISLKKITLSRRQRRMLSQKVQSGYRKR